LLRIEELKNIKVSVKIENIEDDSVFLSSGQIDSRLCSEGSIYFCLKGRYSDGHDYIKGAINNGAKLAVVDKNFVPDSGNGKFPLLYCDNVELFMGHIAKLWIAKSGAKIIGITGTNGKTTTKDYLLEILKTKFKNVVATKGNFNNFQGVPLTIFNISSETEIAIIEIGTNSKGEIKYLADIVNPDIAIITNIGKGHLEKLGDELGVFEEKYSLFKQVINHKARGTIFVNLDDKYLKTIPERSSCLVQVMRFISLEKHDFYEKGVYFSNIGTDKNGYGKFTYKDIVITLNSFGELNLRNALAAISIADLLGIDVLDMKKALESVKISSKRGEVKVIGNSEIILDCYNANPSSMIEILKTFSKISKDTFFVIGDMLELGNSSVIEHSNIGKYIIEEDIRFGKIFIFGNEMKYCYDELLKIPNVHYFNDFDLMKKEFGLEYPSHKRIVFKASRGMELEKLLNN